MYRFIIKRQAVINLMKEIYSREWGGDWYIKLGEGKGVSLRSPF